MGNSIPQKKIKASLRMVNGQGLRFAPISLATLAAESR